MRISRLRTSATKAPKGFTLIEMLVVVALAGLLGAVALPAISNVFRVQIDTALRHLAYLAKETYNSTMLTGRIHRIVYDLKENQYWVESAPAGTLMHTEASREKEEDRIRRSKKEIPKSPFEMDPTVTPKKVTLPRGVKFEDIKTEEFKEPIKEGLAYTHFFPRGVTERTIVHLKDSADHKISLIFSVLTGKTRLVREYVEEKDAREY